MVESALSSSPDDLYHQFKEKVRERNESDLPQDFECLTSAHLGVLRNLRARRSLTDDETNICKKLEIMLNEESHTWALVKALFKDQTEDKDEQMAIMNPGFSEEQLMANFYMMDSKVRRMQIVIDWLEANEASDLDYKEEEDKVEFYSEGPVAWENTFYAIRASYNINVSALDVTMHPDVTTECCPAMDPDAPIRTKKSLVHSDKELEIRLFKHLFRFIRAGKLAEAQNLAQRVGYHWLAAILDGWLPFSDPNLDEENLGMAAIHQPTDLRPVFGNKKRHDWKQTCFKTSKTQGLNTYEKAILGVFGGSLKSVLPVCTNWSDQLWARLKCSIDVKIERALKEVPQENRHPTDFPPEFYSNDHDIQTIFRDLKELKLVSPFKEATIHQTIQTYFILNDIDGLLIQLEEWSTRLEYDNNLADNNEAISPQFLRFFAHIVVYLRELNLVTADDPRGTRIIESYISLLTQQKSIENVAFYTVFLPRENQILSYAKLLATIDDREQRKFCLSIAQESNLDVDEITQTVVEIIRNEPIPLAAQETTKTTSHDQRKIDALDYLLYLDSKNFMAILHHGNALMRLFALFKKMDAIKDTYLKLPNNLGKRVEEQWKLHTNRDITPSLHNKLNELEGFRVLLEAQEELTQWTAWHHKKPEEPKEPANMSNFVVKMNYEKDQRQYQQDIGVWMEQRKTRTNSLTNKITELFFFPEGWMRNATTTITAANQQQSNQSVNNEDDKLTNQSIIDGKSDDDERVAQLNKLRKIYIPQMAFICFNILQLTERYEDCLTVSHLLAQDELKLYEEFTKPQLREFLAKISEVSKIMVRQSINASG